MKKNKKILIATVAGAALAGIAAVACYFFAPMASGHDTEYVYIDNDDTIDSVYAKVSPIANSMSMSAFRMLTNHSSYATNVRSGRYAIRPGEGALIVFRHMKNGLQTPVSLTVPSVRTTDKLAAELSKKLMADSAEIYRALSDEQTCSKFGYDTATIACMFIPNTYDIYWNTSVERLLERMEKECKTFWNGERTAQAEALKLTPVQVTTLASIVDEETANNAEKPMVAGMYYNRLMLRNAE